MKLLRYSLDAPAANLALDEALLDLTDSGGPSVLRLWESRVPFVVVGYGNDPEREANLAACAAEGVPILRRCSGGGTVVQGPGCLSYAVTLPLSAAAGLESISGANRFVMERLRVAIQPLVAKPVAVQGHTDLCVESAPGLWIKFSGNAQRRRKDALLFHGTLLLEFDLALVARVLRFPSHQPNYRADRTHSDFVCNLGLDVTAVQTTLIRQWNAHVAVESVPDFSRLMTEKYSRPEWHRHRR